MRIPTKIFLIGPMGTGKTTIGKHLAAKLKLEFNDTDAEIQKRTGVDILTIFEYEGEEGFRKREAQIIDEMTQKNNQVLATGGGAVELAENRNHLSARGFVIYLSCSVEQQFERTGMDKARPLLNNDDPKAALAALMEKREAWYKETADLEVSTEQRGAASVVNEIIMTIEAI